MKPRARETIADAKLQLPFGRFFGRASGERTFPGFALARFTPTVPRSAVRPHRHEEAHFVFVLQGAYETSARPAADGSAPRVIYSPPGTVHRDCFLHEDISASAFATLSVSGSVLDAAATETKLPEDALCLPKTSAALVRQIFLESQGPDDLGACITEALCIELLERTGIARDPVVDGAPSWLRRARELLRDTSLERSPRSVGEIATVLAIHPVHLARRFRRHFGVTPGEYLRRCRLDRARSLLRRSNAPLAEIATATGFSDQSHLSKAFRNTFGVSPRAFRRSLRG